MKQSKARGRAKPITDDQIKRIIEMGKNHRPADIVNATGAAWSTVHRILNANHLNKKPEYPKFFSSNSNPIA